MNNKRAIASAAGLLVVVAASTVWLLSNPKTAEVKERNLSDEALLALIKNDQRAFEEAIQAGAKIHDALPLIDGKTYTIAEGMAYFDRPHFMKYLRSKSISYIEQKEGKSYDIMTLAVGKNNVELLNELSLAQPDYKLAYGKSGWSLLHMASALCSHKITGILHKTGKLNWDLKAKDGSTPLTLAADHDCLPMLSYWKEQGADFKKKDGRGVSALAILKKKKDAALVAFAESFEPRKVASVTPPVPDFYKKRKIPKDQIVDHSALIEPEERPMEATETAEFSEFAD